MVLFRFLMLALAAAPPSPPEAELNAEGSRGALASDSGDILATKVSDESEQLEALHALENVTVLEPAMKPNADLLGSLRRLGLASPLRQRVLSVLEGSDLVEEAP